MPRPNAAAVGRDRPSPFQWGFFGGLGVLIAYITFLVLDSIRDTLVMIAIATLLAIGLDPLVSSMTRRGLRRGAGVAVVFLGLLLVIAAAVYAIIPPIVNEVGSFVASVPILINELQTNDTVQNLDQRFGLLEALRNSNIVQSVGSGAAGGILSAGFTVATVFADLLIVLVLTLYFLAGFPRIKAAAYRLGAGVAPGPGQRSGRPHPQADGRVPVGGHDHRDPGRAGRGHLRLDHRTARTPGRSAWGPPCWTSSRWSARSSWVCPSP